MLSADEMTQARKLQFRKLFFDDYMPEGEYLTGTENGMYLAIYPVHYRTYPSPHVPHGKIFGDGNI